MPCLLPCLVAALWCNCNALAAVGQWYLEHSALLALIHGHWSIESRHWVRDVVFGEDGSRLRGGHPPQIMATLRTLAFTLIRRTRTTAIAAKAATLPIIPPKPWPSSILAFSLPDNLQTVASA